MTALRCPVAGTLTLHEADLLQDGAFDEVVRGAHFVFHTASPFFIKAETDAQKELIDPALKGTQVRLMACFPWSGCEKRQLSVSVTERLGSSMRPEHFHQDPGCQQGAKFVYSGEHSILT